MIKLLIADDEPLVQIGLNSMLDWASCGIHICGTAGNGELAYEMICREHPDIVITDIKMPLISGLELAEKCRREFGRLPVFIILTSYEDFHYAREALTYQVIDYLVKLELTPEILSASIKKAIETVKEQQNRSAAVPEAIGSSDLEAFRERFYIRLLNNLFENRSQYLNQVRDFQIDFHFSGYVSVYIRILENEKNPLTQEQRLTLNNSTRQMFQEMMSKYVKCQVVSLDIQYFAAILSLSQEQVADYRSYLRTAFQQTCEMLYNYYSVTLFCSIGRLVNNPEELGDSYYDARQDFPYADRNSMILFADEQTGDTKFHNVFSLSLFRESIREAFEESNVEALHSTLQSIARLLLDSCTQTAQAMDAAGSILHLTINLLADGQEITNKIFQDEPDGCQSLYRQNSVQQIVQWLGRLERGLALALQEQRQKNYNYLVDQVKKYISANIGRRLTLQDTAMTFSISPNYLSQLFKRYTETGFNEYVAQKKIEHARTLLRQGNLKIYEIADRLGFENAFYFSKVFKKVEGCSPREYLNRR